MYIINPRSWKLPSQHNGTIHPRLWCIIILRKRYNTPKDVNVIAYHPLLEFSTFRIGIDMRKTLSLLTCHCWLVCDVVRFLHNAPLLSTALGT